jgi:hypothetical protein
MIINDLGGDLRSLAYPALIAGASAPPALYLGFRSFGFARSISVLMASALLISDIHILYSGRVKAYTLDTLVVLGLAVALPRLAKVTWTPAIAATWALAAIVLGSLSGYILLATAVAALVLFLNPAGDRVVRLAALAAQGVVQLIYYVWAQRSTDLADIESVMESIYDGHMTWSWNPIDLGSEMLTHLERVVTVYPGGTGIWLDVLGVLAVVGLVLAVAQRSDTTKRLPAQFFLILIGIAVVGAFVGRFPFGTTTEYFFSSGGRHTLWLAPALAYGLAFALYRARGLAASNRPGLRLGLDAVLALAAIMIIVQGFDTPPRYISSGSATATQFLDAALRPGDVAIITQGAVYSYANSTENEVTLVPTPDRQVGYIPVYRDDPIYSAGSFGEVDEEPALLQPLVEDADRVLTYISGMFSASQDRKAMVETLEPLGFRLTTSVGLGPDHTETIQIWTR